MRRLVGSIAFVEQKLETVVDQGEVEEQAVARETVATVADDLDAALRVVAADAGEDFVVREAVLLFDFGAFGNPGPDEGVVVLGKLGASVRVKDRSSYLVVANRYRFVHIVPNGPYLLMKQNFLLRSRFLQDFLFLLQSSFLRKQICCILFSLCE